MLLAADGEFAFELQVERLAMAAAGIAAYDGDRAREEASGRDGVFDGEDGGERFVFGAHELRRRRCAASSVSPSTQATGCW